MNNERGVIYIVKGAKYVELAALSATSLKTFCPNIPVHIFADCDTNSYACFDTSTKVSEAHAQLKVDHIFNTPFQRTLYLDADTRVCEDISNIFALLDRCEIALAHSPDRKNGGLERYGYTGQAPKSFKLMNCGVILFKKTDSVIELLKNWQKAFHKEGFKRDEFSFREQLWLSNVQASILPLEYNCRPEFNIRVLKRAQISPKILHLGSFNKELGIISKTHLSRSFSRRIKYFIKTKVIMRLRCMLKGLPY